MADTSHDLPASDDAAEEVFLSPRVIDMQAFEDLETRLRKLIEHALDTGQALVSLDEKAQGALGALREAEPALDERQQSAATLLSRLDQRVSAAEALLSKAIERAERADRFEGDVADTVARAERTLQERLDAMTSQAEERLRTAQAEATGRISELSAEFKRTIDDAVSEARDEAEAVSTKLAETRRQAEAGTEDLQQRLETLRDEANDLRTPVLENLNDLCNRAAALLGRDPGVPEDVDAATAGSMGDLVNRAEGLRDDAEFAIRQLEQVSKQTDKARALLGESLVESTDLIDRLGEKQQALHESLGASAELCEQAEAAMQRRAEELREAIDLPLKQADIEAQRLANLIEQAGASGKDLGSALEHHKEVLGQIDEAMARLEPWRATLLDGTDDLPAPLERVVARLREEIGADIARIADGLHSIATRAEDVRTNVGDPRR